MQIRCDNILNQMIKIIHKCNREILRIVFEKYLNLNSFPGIWKNEKLNLINKLGNEPTNVNAFRPITLFLGLRKVFEKNYKILLKPRNIEKKNHSR